MREFDTCDPRRWGHRRHPVDAEPRHHADRAAAIAATCNADDAHPHVAVRLRPGRPGAADDTGEARSRPGGRPTGLVGTPRLDLRGVLRGRLPVLPWSGAPPRRP